MGRTQAVGQDPQGSLAAHPGLRAWNEALSDSLKACRRVMRVLFVFAVSLLATVRVTDGQLLPREEACRFCYRQCPIACFVGTCGLEYGFSVQRYEQTNQCYT